MNQGGFYWHFYILLLSESDLCFEEVFGHKPILSKTAALLKTSVVKVTTCHQSRLGHWALDHSSLDATIQPIFIHQTVHPSNLCLYSLEGRMWWVLCQRPCRSPADNICSSSLAFNSTVMEKNVSIIQVCLDYVAPQPLWLLCPYYCSPHSIQTMTLALASSHTEILCHGQSRNHTLSRSIGIESERII